MAIEEVYGQPAPGPYTQVMASTTTICWIPTFEPFVEELPANCDWISFGEPGPISREFERLTDRWKHGSDSDALQQLVPERFVRSTLVDHISRDLTRGFAGRWDVSVDPLHGRVINARFSEQGGIEQRGIALPILVPRVGDLDWDDVRRLRRRPEIRRLRNVLREIEAEALQVTREHGDIESAMHNAYQSKLLQANERVRLLRSAADIGITELVAGAGPGLAITGFTSLGPIVGALTATGATAVLVTSRHVASLARERRQKGWIGVMSELHGLTTT